ncbi:MAG: hypothetical protein ACLGIG_11590 [Actinomycetes bacterium]
MSGWRKCDRCKKVRQTEEFDGDSSTCRACLTAPVRRKAATVTRSTTTPRAAARPAEPTVRRPLLGSVGAGDLEVRERRARRAAHEALAASHPEEFALLLRDARLAEGLRAAAPAAASPTRDAPQEPVSEDRSGS